MSSIGSATSTIISYNGEEIELETALDELYKDIQQNLNHSQCSIRELARLREDDDFMDCIYIDFAIQDYVEHLTTLFSELKNISKQVIGPCPKEYKDDYKKICNDRKEKKKREKLELKEQEKLKSIKE